MESDEDFELLPPPPLHEPKPKLKRLKKALRVPPMSPSNHEGSSPIDSGTLPSDGSSPSAGHVEDSNWGSNPQIDHRVIAHIDASDSDTAKKNNGFGAMRALDFDSIGDGLDGNDEVHSKEMETENEKGEEVADLEIDDRNRKRRSLDEDSEDQEKKRKRKKKGLDGEKQLKEAASNKRRAEKERRENLKQLRAESQRLLRETRDAAFKPIPLVQKPISSILDKIRQRKLEIQKKSSGYRHDNGYDSPVDDDSERGPLDEEISDKVEKAKVEETHTSCAAIDNLNTLHVDGSKEAADYPSGESIPSPMAVGIEPEHEFRAPIDDTQELAYHSQSTDTNDVVCEEPINTSEVPASSMLAMNLKLDSAPPDDDASSDDDDEDDDKENIDPRLHGLVHLPSPPSGDPVKAFVDEEAEEEDNSDNDMQRFQDNEEGEDDDDIEELNEMITPEYEEKSIDREKRDQLHQQWLEQQDTAGMDNLLHKLNCGSKLKEPTLIEEEEDEESKEAENESDEEAENESDEEAEEYIAPSDAVKINLKKAKQMIPQMFTDKDNDYVSSDDEETEKMLDKQCLIDKSEERAAFLSPAEDESSREVFSLIKKLNIVPDTKRKAKVPSFFETSLLGQKVNTSSKSFVGRGRATNHFMATSQKHGSAKVRSFIFGRDDSSSRLSVSMSEDSSEMIQRESQPAKAVSAKFQRSTQKISATLNSTTQESSVSLLDILRRSSLRAEHFVQNVKVQPKESVFDAFKLAKKPIKTDAGI